MPIRIPRDPTHPDAPGSGDDLPQEYLWTGDIEVPVPDPNPDPGVTPNPSPDSDPSPNPNPDPSVDPVPNPDPGTKPEGDTVVPMLDLTGVFLFCLPFDICKMLQCLAADLVTPRFEIAENALFPGSSTYVIELSKFDGLAANVRTFEFLVFCIGLAVNSKRLLGW